MTITLNLGADTLRALNNLADGLILAGLLLSATFIITRALPRK